MPRAFGYDRKKFMPNSYETIVEAETASKPFPSSSGQMFGGYFSPGEADRFRPIVDGLTHGGDYYLLTADYPAYIATQEKVDQLYLNQDEWTRRAILNVARMGKFSSDRTVQEYADEIWNVKSWNV